MQEDTVMGTDTVEEWITFSWKMQLHIPKNGAKPPGASKSNARNSRNKPMRDVTVWGRDVELGPEPDMEPDAKDEADAPLSMTQEVERIIAALGLEKCRKVLCGNKLIKGISGGEKKRVSVGIELITKPQMIFLDEPTSGLDSFAWIRLIENLKQI